MAITDPAAAPRTLADQLRAWSSEQLTALLRARPDLATPTPQDSTQLASRAVARSSVLRALDGLNAFELSVLQAVVQEGERAPSVLRADPESIAATLRQLTGLALLWGTPPRPVSGVSDALLVSPGPDRVDLDGLSAPARAILDHLVREGPDGRYQRRSAPTEELLTAGLLVRRDDQHVTVPWSVRLFSHGGHSSATTLDTEPPLATSVRERALVDRAAGGAAFEFVRRTDLLLDSWGTTPPGALRAGGLGVRDLKATAALLHVENHEAAFFVETAFAAGLLDRGRTASTDESWLPTDSFDAWQAKPVAERWAVLARAWIGNLRRVSAIGTRVADKPVNALSLDLERAWLPGLRAEVLHVLDTLPSDEVLAVGTGLPSLMDRLRWHRPRRPDARLREVEALLSEAALLGVTGLGGLSALGGAVLAEDDVAHLDGLFPRTVDHILLQADLTAIAPGPLDHTLAHQLALVADVESRGGATVYRFSAASVRRAFDSGWSAAEVHTFLDSVSRTPVPQALAYLVDDVARRFGTLRVGHAESFLRSDDEAALTELQHHPEAHAMRLRRIAPTVLISDMTPAALLPRLRALGLAPVIEAVDGTVRVARPEVQRTRARRGRAPASVRATVHDQAVVAAIRAGDAASASRPVGRGATTTVEVMALLRSTVEQGARVVIGYVGNDGTVGDRVVTPRQVEGGRLTAYDERSDAERDFAIHRITSVIQVG